MTFTAESLPSLAGKVYIVTGGNNGIGHSTVAGLANKGARVYMASRSASKAKAAIEGLKAENPEADIRFLELDNMRFASVLDAVRQFNAQETELHGLINNAGVMATDFALSEDGYENQFQTNYLSHWLLTYHLLPTLQRTAAAGQPGDVRVVMVSSDGHSFLAPRDGIRFEDTALANESSRTRYGQSKLANVLHARHFSKLYGPERPGEIWSASVHPGVVLTGLLDASTGFGPAWLRTAMTKIGACTGLMVTEQTGALSSLWTAASPEFPRTASGSYVVPTARVSKASAFGQDDALAEKLWTWTEEQLRAKGVLTL